MDLPVTVGLALALGSCWHIAAARSIRSARAKSFAAEVQANTSEPARWMMMARLARDAYV